MKARQFLNLKVLLFVLLLFSSQSISGPRRMLLELFTGTWCGDCPCGDSLIEHIILPQYPQTIVLAYHSALTDPFQYFNGNNIVTLLGAFGYPSAIFDRQSGNQPVYIESSNWLDTCIKRYTNKPDSDVDITFTFKSFNTTTRVLTADVGVKALINLSGQYKINFVITENNIVYPQQFYSVCGVPGIHQNYIHHWVVRDMVNSASGENLNTGNWNQNQTITKTINTTLDTGWAAANCNLIIFVYKDTPPLIKSTVEQSSLQSVIQPIGVIKNTETPKIFKLEQNYPNPFNPVTNIKCSIPKSGNVSLKIYDVLGNEVSIILDGYLKAGVYNAEVNASNFASGVYFYTLKTDDFVSTKKMLLVK